MNVGFLSDYKSFPVGLPSTGCAADPDSSGYVYIIGFSEPDIVKIGSATAVGVRLAELQCGNPFELKVIAAVSIYEARPILIEFAAHKIAKEMGAHIRGEWFELSADDALRCVIEAAKSKRVKYSSFHGAMKKQNKMLQDKLTAEGEKVRHQKLVRFGLA